MQFQQERERALSHIFRAISRSIYEYSRIEDNDPKVLLLWLLVSNSDGDPVTYFPNQKLILIYKKKIYLNVSTNYWNIVLFFMFLWQLYEK